MYLNVIRNYQNTRKIKTIFFLKYLLVTFIPILLLEAC